MAKIFTKSTLWTVIAAIMAVYMVNVPLAIKPWLTDKGPTWLGLDVSWQMTLNYASVKHWLFGKDIIFTYGPLAYLSTRYGYGVPLWEFIFFDLFVVANFFFVFKDFICSSGNGFFATLTIFCLTLLVNRFYGSDTSWVLLFFLFYWFYKSFTKPSAFYFIPIYLLLLLSFYIKQNTWLLGSVAFIFHLVNLYFSKKIKMIYGAAVLFILVFFFILSLQFLNVSLAGYIKNSFEIIKGYNDVMYLNGDHKALEIGVTALFWILLLLFTIQGIAAVKKKNYSMLFFSAISIAYLFLLYKQASLRGDVQHLSEFFFCGPLILIYGGLSQTDVKRQRAVHATIFLTIFTSVIFINDKRPLRDVIYDRFTTVNDYIKEVHEYGGLQYLDQKDKRFIPQYALEQIGQKSIDIFPWDCEYLIENKLNYTPRPVFQSYTAYTENLEKINYNFYVNKAPDFVVYDYDAIDGRYPFNDECLVNLFLRKNYTLADTFTSNERWRILLQKKEKTLPVILNKVKEESVNISSVIPVNGFSFLKIHAEYNIAGRLKSLLSKPPAVSVMFQRSNGDWLTYKTSLELLKSGLYVGRLITDNNEFARWLSANDTLTAIQNVKLSLDPGYFSHQMKIECIDVQ